MLADPHVDFGRSRAFLGYSLTNHEGDFGLRPLLIAIYLDRLLLRMGGEDLPTTLVDGVHDIARTFEYGENKAAVHAVLLARYVKLVKHEQQLILSWARSSSSTIKDSPQTLEDMRRALSRHESLLEQWERVLRTFGAEVEASVEGRWLWSPAWESQVHQSMVEHEGLLRAYRAGLPELRAIVIAVEKHQACLADSSQCPWRTWQLVLLWAVATGALALVWGLWKRRA